MSLDKTSLAIGSLTAEVKILTENQDRLINFIKESTNRVETALTKHAESDAANFKILNDKVATFEQFQTRVYTVASICAVLCTGIINIGLSLFSKK